MKPLNRKSYGSIPHIIGSKRGPSDSGLGKGQCDILFKKQKVKGGIVIATEKLDGSNVSVYYDGTEYIPLTRSGNLASSSVFKHHRQFAAWVRDNLDKFQFLLPGERVCGEWLGLAHGTVYELTHAPFVSFDIMVESDRLTYDLFIQRTYGLVRPKMLHYGDSKPFEQVLESLGEFGHHGAKELAEGIVWRYERDGKVQFLAKYVRHEKIAGKYLDGPEIWLYDKYR